MKNYIGFSRDHSVSMTPITRQAARDYNDNITVIKEEAIANNIDTIVSVVKCGTGRPARTEREIVNSNITTLQPIPESSYRADGNRTPLFDSVGDLIEQFEAVPDANDPDVSFLITVITDGEENASVKWPADKLRRKIGELQATDRWSFVFRVPNGYAAALQRRLGIPDGNILEWEQTGAGFERATKVTATAVRSYFSARKSGQKGTSRFFTSLGEMSAVEIKSALNDISRDVNILPVSAYARHGDIRAFVEEATRKPMLRGAAFYQLTKTEEVQDHKQIIIREKTTGKIYGGAAARQLLALPSTGMVKLSPGNNGNFDVFVQSTSVNRKLVPGTNLLLWENAVR